MLTYIRNLFKHFNVMIFKYQIYITYYTYRVEQVAQQGAHKPKSFGGSLLTPLP